MAYLLDTNVCVQLLNGQRGVIRRLKAAAPDEIKLCAVVLAELAYGAYNSGNVASNVARLQQFAQPYASLPFDDRAGYEYGLIRADLRKRGKPVGANDLMIAAIARAHDLTLVTHNTDEFSHVPGLQLEDWQA